MRRKKIVRSSNLCIGLLTSIFSYRGTVLGFVIECSLFLKKFSGVFMTICGLIYREMNTYCGATLNYKCGVTIFYFSLNIYILIERHAHLILSTYLSLTFCTIFYLCIIFFSTTLYILYVKISFSNYCINLVGCKRQ